MSNSLVSGPGYGVPGHAALYGIVPELTDIPAGSLSSSHFEGPDLGEMPPDG
jgi:hypothetical protein